MSILFLLILLRLLIDFPFLGWHSSFCWYLLLKYYNVAFFVAIDLNLIHGTKIASHSIVLCVDITLFVIGFFGYMDNCNAQLYLPTCSSTIKTNHLSGFEIDHIQLVFNLFIYCFSNPWEVSYSFSGFNGWFHQRENTTLYYTPKYILPLNKYELLIDVRCQRIVKNKQGNS